MTDLKKYERYAELKGIVAEAEKELKEINAVIVKELSEFDIDEFPTEFGKFTISKRKKWVYPEEVLLLETRFKEAKIESEQIGTAGYVDQLELRFSKPKPVNIIK